VSFKIKVYMVRDNAKTEKLIDISRLNIEVKSLIVIDWGYTRIKISTMINRTIHNIVNT